MPKMKTKITHAKSATADRRHRGTGHLADMDAKKVIKELFPYGASR
jgi:large subunit ribosomal protein L35